jgi:hypothetical protein
MVPKASKRRDRARRLAGSLRRYAKPGTVKSVRVHVRREVARAAAAEGASDAKDFRRSRRVREVNDRAE